jgi:hypothetical protein
VFFCGWHITRDGQNAFSWRSNARVNAHAWLGKLTRFAHVDDQVEAWRRIFASDMRWTVWTAPVR